MTESLDSTQPCPLAPEPGTDGQQMAEGLWQLPSCSHFENDGVAKTKEGAALFTSQQNYQSQRKEREIDKHYFKFPLSSLYVISSHLHLIRNY